MYNNFKIGYIFLIAISLVATSYAQTDHWRLIWDQNDEENMSHYLIFKGTSPSPTLEVGQINHPDTVYEDSVIDPGILYYYRVKAVDDTGSVSDYSVNTSAAIPQIVNLPDSIPLPINASYNIYLNVFVNDPDTDFDDLADSLSWYVNGLSSYSNGNGSLQIEITDSDSLLVTTNDQWSGSETLTFSVVDNDSFFDVTSLIISFTVETNQSPIISSNPGLFVNVGELYEYSLTATDPDGDALTFSIVELPAFLDTTHVNANTVLISGTPDIDDAGDHSISVLVLDLMGGSVLHTFTLNVNQVPIITTSPALNAIVDQVYTYQFIAVDPDDDPMTFTVDPLPDFLDVVDVTDTSLRLTGTPGFGDIGAHSITIDAGDGKGGSDTQSYVLTVLEEGTIIVSGLNAATFVANVVKLSWDTDVETKDYIQYGLNAGYGNSSNVDSSYSTSHEKIIRNLLPETTYHYRIVSENALGAVSFSVDATFSTMAAGEEVIAFPVPYVFSEHQESTHGISFVNLPANSTLYIYNLMGEMVFRKRDLNNAYTWGLYSKSGKFVQSGLYIYRVERGSKEFGSGKVIIVR